MEHYWRAVVRGERRGILASCMRGVLTGISLPYRAVVSLRNIAYDRGWKRSFAIPNCFVVSVGNSVVGGTGKTPIILKLAEDLLDLHPAIISRGYRSDAESAASPLLACDGQGPLLSPRVCGDEPFLMASRLPSLRIVVGRDRVAGAELAAQMGSRLILLDDAMQHRRIKRQLNIVVMHAQDPFGRNALFPRGFLREPLSGLRRADLIVLHHATSSAQCDAIKAHLTKYTDAPVVGTFIRLENVPALSGKRVGLFCGIGSPESFIKSVQALGAQVVDTLLLSDHEGITQAALKNFSLSCKAKGAEQLICTEKDWVKLPENLDATLPVVYTSATVAFTTGEEHWQALLAKIKMFQAIA